MTFDKEWPMWTELLAWGEMKTRSEVIPPSGIMCERALGNSVTLIGLFSFYIKVQTRALMYFSVNNSYCVLVVVRTVLKLALAIEISCKTTFRTLRCIDFDSFFSTEKKK